MALSGIEIFKQLPKTNCKECDFPTCLAFAMSLSQGKSELEQCPHVSDEAKAMLSEASEPPIRTVSIGANGSAVKVGGETVAFRHEKTFVNHPPLAILVTDGMDDGEVDARLGKMEQLQYDRVGLTLRPEMVAVQETQGDADKFAGLVGKVVASGCGMVLISSNADVLAAGLKACDGQKPLLYGANKDNADQIGGLAKENGCPVGVKGDGIDELMEVTEKLTGMGLKDLVIDSGARSLGAALKDQIAIRRAALSGDCKPLGFPTIVFPGEMTDDPLQEVTIAATLIAKYAGLVVLSDFDGASLFPLLLERLNIFTDPQRPMATEEGIYEIGGPDENSPVLITSNFSLSYFIVSGEIETSRIPCYLLVKDTEGLSVLTAWAAGKFVADEIGPFVQKCGIADKVKHRKLIIPGFAAQISGELEDELPDWEIVIGPREAAHIPAFLKS
ncbi:MAG: acetyl-CoA decarbonylase/synthase complex subunit gamma [Gemmatimonadetes bacterium]|jgi:acetyl-CoA decarbonylase/synthase, CODH/ACS complex subunit gamma|nr:acetyl-CoA decarbonylase/synthase complex subunit gamma [Gemmatimonadota bacterium]